MFFPKRNPAPLGLNPQPSMSLIMIQIEFKSVNYLRDLTTGDHSWVHHVGPLISALKS